MLGRLLGWAELSPDTPLPLVDEQALLRLFVVSETGRHTPDALRGLDAKAERFESPAALASALGKAAAVRRARLDIARIADVATRKALRLAFPDASAVDTARRRVRDCLARAAPVLFAEGAVVRVSAAAVDDLLLRTEVRCMRRAAAALVENRLSAEESDLTNSPPSAVYRASIAVANVGSSQTDPSVSSSLGRPPIYLAAPVYPLFTPSGRKQGQQAGRAAAAVSTASSLTGAPSTAASGGSMSIVGEPIVNATSSTASTSLFLSPAATALQSPSIRAQSFVLSPLSPTDRDQRAAARARLAALRWTRAGADGPGSLAVFALQVVQLQLCVEAAASEAPGGEGPAALARFHSMEEVANACERFASSTTPVPEGPVVALASWLSDRPQTMLLEAAGVTAESLASSTAASLRASVSTGTTAVRTFDATVDGSEDGWSDSKSSEADEEDDELGYSPGFDDSGESLDNARRGGLFQRPRSRRPKRHMGYSSGNEADWDGEGDDDETVATHHEGDEAPEGGDLPEDMTMSGSSSSSNARRVEGESLALGTGEFSDGPAVLLEEPVPEGHPGAPAATVPESVLGVGEIVGSDPAAFQRLAASPPGVIAQLRKVRTCEKSGNCFPYV